jgi:hypothetical protein
MEDTTAITRRQALRGIGAAGLGVGALGGLDALLAAAASAAPKPGSLRDIQHVVILMQESRSFDHYFGMLPGVRGFADKQGRSAFFQKTSAGKTLHPFHLRKVCLPDISHECGPQHRSWNGGKMNGFVTAREPAYVNGRAVAVETMGYYDRSDLHFYYALLLRAGRRLHDLRLILLLGDRADRPEPADVDVGHDRPGRNARRTAAADKPDQPHERLQLEDDARAAVRQGGELEDLHRRRRRRARQRAHVLQAVHAQIETPRAGRDAVIPRRLPRGHRPPQACRRCRGS